MIFTHQVTLSLVCDVVFSVRVSDGANVSDGAPHVPVVVHRGGVSLSLDADTASTSNRGASNGSAVMLEAAAVAEIATAHFLVCDTHGRGVVGCGYPPAACVRSPSALLAVVVSSGGLRLAHVREAARVALLAVALEVACVLCVLWW
jgi:hypothetical protein